MNPHGIIRGLIFSGIAASVALGCNSNDAGPAETILATQVPIADTNLVTAPHVEGALQTLWPLMGQQDSTLAAIQALEQRLAAAEQALSTPAPAPAPTVVLEPGSDPIPLQLAVDTLYLATKTLDARANYLEADRDQLLIALQTANAEIEALKSLQNTAHQEVTEAIESVAAALTEPRPCPPDMIEIGNVACMEKQMRPKHFFKVALTDCLNEGLRMCRLEEMHYACVNYDEESEFGETSVRLVPHWFGDSGDRLKHPTGNWLLAGMTISGLTCQGDMFQAGTSVQGPDTVDGSYHYRCCIDRL